MKQFFLLTVLCGLAACASSPPSHVGSRFGDRMIRVYRCNSDQPICDPVYSALLERPEGCYDFFIEGRWAGAWLIVTNETEGSPVWLPAMDRPELINTDPVRSYATKLLYCNTAREPGEHLLTLAGCHEPQCDPDAGSYAQFKVVIR